MTSVNPEISCIRMGSGPALFGLARFYCISVIVSSFVGTKPTCGKEERTPKCKKTCEDGYNVTFEKDLHFGDSSYSVRSVEKIQTEIMTNGPVEGTFTVYADFLTYKTGTIYIKHDTRFLLIDALPYIVGLATK